MRTLRQVAGFVGATILAASCGGQGVSAPTSQVHRLTRPVTLAGLPRPLTARVTLTFPAAWRVVAVRTGRVSLREGSEQCTYRVDAAVDIVSIEGATATDATRSLVPTGDGRLLETGARGSAAWRVVKLRGQDRQIRVTAVHAQPLRYVSQQVGHPTWLTTTLRAVSDRGDECHAGTYRDTLGPRLGDALATQRGRA